MIKFKDLIESHKVGDKVTILKGSEKGKEGRIGEIRKGLYKGAPKTFTVDYDHHETTGARKSIQVKAKHIQKIKEDTEMLQEKHRVSITVSDPNNPSVDKRKELIQKTVRIEADNEGHAIDSAIAHYKKAGYKVHDHSYVGTVKEDLEEAMSNAQERGAADKHYGRKYNNPHDKGSQEHSDYHKGYHSTESEKDYGGSKGKPLHKFESTVTESALERFRKAAAEREKEANKREAEMKARHASGKEDMKGAIDTLAKKMNNEETQLDEISQKLAGDYYGAVVKQQAKKTGLKPDLYHKLEPKRQKGIDRATDRLMSKEEVAANNVGGGNIAGTQGDAGKKTVMTKSPLKRKLKFEEFSDLLDNCICETAEAGLAAKAAKSGISISTLRKVYRRGVAAWNSGHRPGTTPQQWGMARVNSYITKGKGTYHGADKDLREESLDEAESWEAGYERRVVKTTKPEHKDAGYNWRIKGKERPEISIKLYKDKPSQEEFNKQMKRVAGHEFGESVSEDSRLDNDAYHKGVSPSTAKARVSHWKKMDKLSDKNPEAYKPAPGDATAKTKLSKHTIKYRQMFGEDMDEELYEACWSTHKQVGMKKKGDKMVPNCVPKNESAEEQFDMIEEVIEELASLHGVDSDEIWQDLETIEDDELLEYAIDKKGHKSSEGGLTQKGVDYYNRKTGGNLQTAVTTPPSKLKPGSKAAKRRKSFCARMGGMKKRLTSAKTANDPDSRINKALRKWNC
jgi:ribosomal protein L24